MLEMQIKHRKKLTKKVSNKIKIQDYYIENERDGQI